MLLGRKAGQKAGQEVAEEATEAVTSELPNIGDKLKYVSGKATGNAHNEIRSKEMLRQLNSIGILDNNGGHL